MPQGGSNSFFRFVLGFSVFIIVSLGMTFAVSAYAIKKEKEAQAAAAFKTMLNQQDARVWWKMWR